MMDKSIHDVESRFNGLKVKTKPEDWLNVDYLLNQVEALSKTDLALAYRLMQRVKNLEPTDTMIAKLGDLKAKVQTKTPVVLKTTLSKDSKKKKIKSNVKRYLSLLLKKSRHPKLKMLSSPFYLVIVLPFLLFAFYQVFLASDRYESRVMVIIKSPDAVSTLDPAMALLSGLGSATSTGDNELLKSYIYSMDLLTFLDNQIQLKEHYSDDAVDLISRLDKQASSEDFLAYFKSRVTIDVDAISGVLTINAQGFEPSYTQKIAAAISLKAESFINRIGNDLAQSQLEFVKKEHEVTELRLQEAKSKILEFQKRYNLLDPEAEGMALQRITYELESQIAAKKAEVGALKSAMSESAPQVLQIRSQLESLEQQLRLERERLTNENNAGGPSGEVGVSEILSQFSKLKIGLEFALQAYASSQVSLEKSRVEAYRQIKYLVMIESPVLPEDAKYPKVLYNLGLFLAAALMLFGIGKIIMATVNELR
jgi:capsular polysaccharide transport system permease protein